MDHLVGFPAGPCDEIVAMTMAYVAAVARDDLRPDCAI